MIVPLLLAACGSEERADVDEPEGEYPIEIVDVKFPEEQRLAQTSDFKLEVQNTGTETVPNLAVTINLDGGEADGAFSVRLDKPELASPNRPVWILENKYPQIAGEPPPKGLSGATVAQTNTFAFGELESGDSREMVWRVTPVRAGSYTVNYVLSAGVFGKAQAVVEGGEPSGEIVVEITDKPPAARVDDDGRVVITD